MFVRYEDRANGISRRRYGTWCRRGRRHISLCIDLSLSYNDIRWEAAMQEHGVGD